MALTDRNVKELNMMNEAARRAGLGDLLKTLEEGAGGDGGDPYVLPAATEDTLGGVLKAATQSDSVATEVSQIVADFNSLLAKLKAAGIMA